MTDTQAPEPEMPDKETLERMVQTFKAIGDFPRVEILRLLKQNAEMDVVAIRDGVNSRLKAAGQAGITQPAISHHLRLLKEADLISYRDDGKYNYYKITDWGKRFIESAITALVPNVKELVAEVRASQSAVETQQASGAVITS